MRRRTWAVVAGQELRDLWLGGRGLLLGGVIGGGPADVAGMQKGDVIVEISGQSIANIYDYTYAMDAVKIGEPVQVVVLRAGERLTLKVTPEARK